MKVHKPIKLFVPSSIMEVISGKVKTKRENYVFIIHYLLLQPCKDKRLSDFVPLNKKKLTTILNCNPTPYIKFLIKYDFIENDKKFIPNKKSYHYRINPAIEFDCNTFELQPNTPLFNSIINDLRRSKANYNLLEPFLTKMRKHLLAIPYDYDNAVKWIKNNANGQKRISYMIAVSMIADQRFRYFARNKTNNRLDTNFTNLKKELRHFIVDNYTQIDLKNSQPFLLGILLEKISAILKHFDLKKEEFNQTNLDNFYKNKHLPKCYRNEVENLVQFFGLQTFKAISKIHRKYDFAFAMNLWKFKEWITEGNFYDQFESEFQLTRSEVKKLMFEILFSQNEIYFGYKRFVPFQNEKKVFASVFPAIYDIIEALKGKDHARLAIFLQRLESHLFIDCIAKELVNSSIIPITVHDSVIIPTDQQEAALNIIKRVFKNEVGHVPSFEVEAIGFDTESGGLEPTNGTNSKVNENIETLVMHG